jgi:hypothetical protein
MWNNERRVCCRRSSFVIAGTTVFARRDERARGVCARIAHDDVAADVVDALRQPRSRAEPSSRARRRRHHRRRVCVHRNDLRQAVSQTATAAAAPTPIKHLRRITFHKKHSTFINETRAKH